MSSPVVIQLSPEGLVPLTAGDASRVREGLSPFVPKGSAEDFRAPTPGAAEVHAALTKTSNSSSSILARAGVNPPTRETLHDIHQSLVFRALEPGSTGTHLSVDQRLTAILGSDLDPEANKIGGLLAVVCFPPDPNIPGRETAMYKLMVANQPTFPLTSGGPLMKALDANIPEGTPVLASIAGPVPLAPSPTPGEFPFDGSSVVLLPAFDGVTTPAVSPAVIVTPAQLFDSDSTPQSLRRVWVKHPPDANAFQNDQSFVAGYTDRPGDGAASILLSMGAVFLPTNHGLPAGLVIDLNFPDAKSLVTTLKAEFAREVSEETYDYLDSPLVTAFLRAVTKEPEAFAHRLIPVTREHAFAEHSLGRAMIATMQHRSWFWMVVNCPLAKKELKDVSTWMARVVDHFSKGVRQEWGPALQECAANIPTTDPMRASTIALKLFRMGEKAGADPEKSNAGADPDRSNAGRRSDSAEQEFGEHLPSETRLSRRELRQRSSTDLGDSETQEPDIGAMVHLLEGMNGFLGAPLAAWLQTHRYGEAATLGERGALLVYWTTGAVALFRPTTSDRLLRNLGVDMFQHGTFVPAPPDLRGFVAASCPRTSSHWPPMQKAVTAGEAETRRQSQASSPPHQLTTGASPSFTCVGLGWRRPNTLERRRLFSERGPTDERHGQERNSGTVAKVPPVSKSERTSGVIEVVDSGSTDVPFIDPLRQSARQMIQGPPKRVYTTRGSLTLRGETQEWLDTDRRLLEWAILDNSVRKGDSRWVDVGPESRMISVPSHVNAAVFGATSFVAPTTRVPLIYSHKHQQYCQISGSEDKREAYLLIVGRLAPSWCVRMQNTPQQMRSSLKMLVDKPANFNAIEATRWEYVGKNVVIQGMAKPDSVADIEAVEGMTVWHMTKMYNSEQKITGDLAPAHLAHLVDVIRQLFQAMLCPDDQRDIYENCHILSAALLEMNILVSDSGLSNFWYSTKPDIRQLFGARMVNLLAVLIDSFYFHANLEGSDQNVFLTKVAVKADVSIVQPATGSILTVNPSNKNGVMLSSRLKEWREALETFKNTTWAAVTSVDKVPDPLKFTPPAWLCPESKKRPLEPSPETDQRNPRPKGEQTTETQQRVPQSCAASDQLFIYCGQANFKSFVRKLNGASGGNVWPCWQGKKVCSYYWTKIQSSEGSSNRVSGCLPPRSGCRFEHKLPTLNGGNPLREDEKAKWRDLFQRPEVQGKWKLTERAQRWLQPS